MNKAEGYLRKRLDLLSDDKVILTTRNNEIDIEIKETENAISQLKKNVDESFEVFSPRSKRNDFVKSEIVTLEKKREELLDIQAKSREKIIILDEEINDIKDALKEEELLSNNSNEENTEYSGINIVKEQEYERKRIAMELHDSAVQMLANLIHKCEICSKIIDVDIIRAKLELEVITKTLREVINELRNIIYNLRPMSFDDIGLDVTIERIISQAKKESNININFTVEGEKHIMGELQSITVIRILQEAISNSKKHSQGKNINITLKYIEQGIYLQICDDGRGFDVEDIKRPEDNNMSGFGISMMKERIHLLNGTIDIKSIIGEGTKITVIIPSK